MGAQSLTVAGPLDADAVIDLDFQVLLLLVTSDTIEHLVIDLSAVASCDRAVVAGLYRIRSRLGAHRATVEFTGVQLPGRRTPLPAAALEELFGACDLLLATGHPLACPPP